MADYRQVHVQMWKDDWFLELNPDFKLLFIYLFSNDRASVAGIYDIGLRVIEFETGIDCDRIKEGLELFAKDGKAFYEDGVVWVVNLRKYNATNSIKVREKIRRDLEMIKDCSLKHRYIECEGIPKGTQKQSPTYLPVQPKRTGHPPGSRASQQSVRNRLINERGQQCERCGTVGLVELHHIIPVRAGGTLDDINSILLCEPCHQAADNENERRYPIFDSQIPYPELDHEHEQEQEQEQEHTTGASAPAADAAPAENGQPSTFQEWQDEIRDSKNRTAVLRRMCEVLYPGLDPPDFGYIGKVAKKVGGAGRLADLLWQHSTRPPTGDLMAYIQGVANNDGRTGSTRKRKTSDAPVITGLGKKPDI